MPLLARLPGLAANVDARQRSGHRIEAGREHERIDVYCLPSTRTPSATIASIGVLLTSTSVTLLRLNVS
jgi:hypothetical protein